MFSHNDKFQLSCWLMVVYSAQREQFRSSAAYISPETGYFSPNNHNSAPLDNLMSTGDLNCDFVFDSGAYDEINRFIESRYLVKV